VIQIAQLFFTRCLRRLYNLLNKLPPTRDVLPESPRIPKGDFCASGRFFSATSKTGIIPGAYFHSLGLEVVTKAGLY
jgi:hypothetical protein